MVIEHDQRPYTIVPQGCDEEGERLVPKVYVVTTQEAVWDLEDNVTDPSELEALKKLEVT